MKNPRADHQSMAKIWSARAESDFAFSLAKVQWDIFTTNTFTDPVPRPAVAYGMAHRWFREIANFSGIPTEVLLTALRGEQGEKGGRFHFHALVGRTRYCNKITLRHFAFDAWRRIANGARTDVRLYDRSLAGADYICKCLGGANNYELNKYSLAAQVTLSNSVARVIRAMDAKGMRRHCEDIRKNAPVLNQQGNNSEIPLGMIGVPVVSRI